MFIRTIKRSSESHPGYGRNWVYRRKSQPGHRRYVRQVVVRRRRRRTFANCRHPCLRTSGRNLEAAYRVHPHILCPGLLEEFTDCGPAGVLRDLT